MRALARIKKDIFMQKADLNSVWIGHDGWNRIETAITLAGCMIRCEDFGFPDHWVD